MQSQVGRVQNQVGRCAETGRAVFRVKYGSVQTQVGPCDERGRAVGRVR